MTNPVEKPSPSEAEPPSWPDILARCDTIIEDLGAESSEYGPDLTMAPWVSEELGKAFCLALQGDPGSSGFSLKYMLLMVRPLGGGTDGESKYKFYNISTEIVVEGVDGEFLRPLSFWETRQESHRLLADYLATAPTYEPLPEEPEIEYVEGDAAVEAIINQTSEDPGMEAVVRMIWACEEDGSLVEKYGDLAEETEERVRRKYNLAMSAHHEAYKRCEDRLYAQDNQ